MKTSLILSALALAALPLAAAPVDWSKLPPDATQNPVTFDHDILPLFQASCIRCHGAERPHAQLRLDSRDGVLKGTRHGAVLTPGDSAHSLLVQSVSQLDPESAMPPKPRPHGAPHSTGTNAPGLQPPAMAGDEHQSAHGTNGPAEDHHHSGPPAKPLTAAQVGLVRAWIDQGAK